MCVLLGAKYRPQRVCRFWESRYDGGIKHRFERRCSAGLEWTLKYSTADITSATMAVGSAATAAGKQMSCTSSAGSSTCLLWGINSTTISSGVVATVALTLSPTTQNTSSSIQLVNGVAAGSNGTAMTTSTAGSTLSIVTAGTSGPVDLSPAFNRIGIVRDGTTFTGGLDGAGNAYSANLLGSTVNAEGTSFALGSPNVNNVVTNTTVTLPAGQFASLAMLATAVNGNQPSQTFTLTYTDGTTSNFVQSLSDWHTPQNYASESEASSMAYLDWSTGLQQVRTTNLYGYLFALNSAKIVKSIKLPANSNVVVLAMTLTTAPPSPDFSLVATPVWQAVAAGTGTSYTAVVAKLNGFSGTVALSASGLPAGAAVTFSPTSLSGSGSSTVSVSTLSTTPTRYVHGDDFRRVRQFAAFRQHHAHRQSDKSPGKSLFGVQPAWNCCGWHYLHGWVRQWRGRVLSQAAGIGVDREWYVVHFRPRECAGCCQQHNRGSDDGSILHVGDVRRGGERQSALPKLSL